MGVKIRINNGQKSEQFEYLQYGENKHTQRADINVLNARLNQTKRTNFFSNTMFVIFFSICVIILSVISIKF